MDACSRTHTQYRMCVYMCVYVFVCVRVSAYEMYTYTMITIN